MQIYRTARKVPGGLLLVPLLMGAGINTLAPEALDVGGFTTALFKTGAASFIALVCFCCGAAVDVRQAASPLTRGATLILLKMAIGAAAGWTVNHWWGPAGVFGIAPLAIVPALTNGSGGIYLALANEYGDAADVGAQSVLLMGEGPFFTMLVFGGAGMAEIPVSAMAASVLPLFLGFILGNLDPEIRRRFDNPEMLIPFFSFCLGAGLDLRVVAASGLPGLVLGLSCLLVCGLAGYFATRLFSPRRRAVGAAIGSTAGNAMATPMFLAAADPSLGPYVEDATAQLAAAVIVTAILCPALVACLDRLEKRFEASRRRIG